MLRSLGRAHNNAAVLKSYEYQSGHYDEAGNPKEAFINRLVTAVFAFSTDLTNTESEFNRYKRLQTEGEPAILQLCVVGRGAWFWYRQQWNEMLPAHPYQEVLAWLTGILVNSQVIWLYATKRGERPRSLAVR